MKPVVAVKSLIKAIRVYLTGNPKTLLRMFYLALVDYYTCIFTRQKLSIKELKEMALILDYAGELNKAYDHKDFSYFEYIKICCKYKRVFGNINKLKSYKQAVLKIENDRPPQYSHTSQIILYRENIIKTVMTVSISELNDRNAHKVILYLSMLSQIIDDLIDAENDQQLGIPSYYTNLLHLPDKVSRFKQMLNLAKKYKAEIHKLKLADAGLSRIVAIILYAISYCIYSFTRLLEPQSRDNQALAVYDNEKLRKYNNLLLQHD